MSRSYISSELRRQIAEQALHRCGYCQTVEEIAGISLQIDHIIPEALGGPTEADNLWLACSQCNSHKSDRTTAVDPINGQTVQLYDPRHQSWKEHFAWVDSATRVVGLTPVGRATVLALQLNRPTVVRARKRWSSVGWHPPST